MSTIAEIARITVKGRPTEGTDSTADRAWLLYTAAMEQASRDGVAPNPDGTVSWVGNMKRLARGLWPEVAWEDKDTAEMAVRDIYNYFYRTSVARVVERTIGGDPTQNRWLLSPSFTSKLTKRDVKRYTASYTEKRLTKAEAGEDRAPAPVTTKKAPVAKKTKTKTAPKDKASVLTAAGSHPCGECGKAFGSLGALGGHRKIHNNHPKVPTRCSICPRDFPSANAYYSHLKSHTPAQRLAAKPVTIVPEVALKTQQKAKTAKVANLPAPAPAVAESAAPVPDVNAAVAALVNALQASTASESAALQAENAALKAQLSKIREAFAV